MLLWLKIGVTELRSGDGRTEELFNTHSVASSLVTS